MPSQQYSWWILTVPKEDWQPCLPNNASYVRGQCERGASGFEHWQLVIHTQTKTTLTNIRRSFGGRAHVEPMRSDAAREYVWKEDTRIEGTQFEYGTPPVRRNVATDWDDVWRLAKAGEIESIPPQIRVCHYSSLRRISSDFGRTAAMDRCCYLFWGRTGTGKSRDAWNAAGMGSYSKDPRTKFWDGYRGEEHVVLDEFRGAIDVSHLLRWLDRYPVRVEIKGSSVPLCAKSIWITSNLPLESWYP